MCLYIWQHFIDLITITVASWNKLYPDNNNKAVTQRFSVNFMGSRKSVLAIHADVVHLVVWEILNIHFIPENKTIVSAHKGYLGIFI